MICWKTWRNSGQSNDITTIIKKQKHLELSNSQLSWVLLLKLQTNLVKQWTFLRDLLQCVHLAFIHFLIITFLLKHWLWQQDVKYQDSCSRNILFFKTIIKDFYTSIYYFNNLIRKADYPVPPIRTRPIQSHRLGREFFSDPKRLFLCWLTMKSLVFRFLYFCK